jgi:2-keto-3-deoxy-L-rhamnonate aldolase RhmA
MNFGILVPIVAILATAWVIVTLLHYRHAGRSGRGASVAEAEDNARLAHENEALRLTIRGLEERMAVLERIATDPAERTAREIEQLRQS